MKHKAFFLVFEDLNTKVGDINVGETVGHFRDRYMKEPGGINLPNS